MNFAKIAESIPPLKERAALPSHVADSTCALRKSIIPPVDNGRAFKVDVDFLAGQTEIKSRVVNVTVHEELIHAKIFVDHVNQSP